MGRNSKKKKKKKQGRESTPQTAENESLRNSPPPDVAVSGTSSNLVICKEGNTLYFESSDHVVIDAGVSAGNVDTVVAGDVQHHYHHHASRSTLEEGARADGDEVDEYQEMEIEADLEPTGEPRTTGENEVSAVEVSTRILQHVQELVASNHNANKWEENAQLCQELHTLFKQQGNASLTKIRFDSVHFFVRVKLGPDHEAFLQACTDGTLWRGLTKLLVTPELKRAAQVKLRLRLKVKEPSNKNDVPAPAKSSPLPSKHLQEMNADEVQKWLIEEVGVPISIATKFAEAGVDGKLLARYEEEHLLKDFQLPLVVMRKIMYARDDRMETSDVTSRKYESLDSGKTSDNENIDAKEEEVHVPDSTVVSRKDKRDAPFTEAEETPTAQKTKIMQDRELGITADGQSQPKQLSKEEEESAGEAKLRIPRTGTSSHLVIRMEGNTLYFESSDNVVVNVGVNVGDVDTVVAGDVQHHYHHHASRSTLEEGARAGADEADQYQEKEIEAKVEPAAKPGTTGKSGASYTEGDPDILQRVQRVIANYHNVEKWKEDFKMCLEVASLFEEQGQASLTKVRFDSIHFFVRVKLGSDHDAFLQACTDGTLSRGLTKLLVTPELEKAAGVKLTVKLDVKEISCAHDERAFVDSSHANTKPLQDMTSTEVRRWLVKVADIPDSIASKFEEEDIDGGLLSEYEDTDLRKDFSLSIGRMRKIINARNRFSKGIKHSTPEGNPIGLGPAERGKAELHHDKKKEGITPGNTEDTYIGETSAEVIQNSMRKTDSKDDVKIESGVDDCGETEVPLTAKEKDSADEARLRYLLTGNESGTLDSSFHPILVMNKPLFEDSNDPGVKILEEKLGFISQVKWNAVFDCDSKSLVNGVGSMVDGKREIKFLLPDTFRKDTSLEEMDFSDLPTWIFANGLDGNDDLEDLPTPSLASYWNEKYGADVDRAVDFFASAEAIPKERAVIVFLILSGDDIQIMSDIFKKFQSSLQGRGSFTFIAESRELYQKWAEEVKRWLPRNQLDKRSIVGTEWMRINRFIQKQYGHVSIAPAKLPHAKGEPCSLPEKTRSKWVNIEVLPSNECEDTDVDEDSPEFQKFVSDEELAFYQGNAVSWWNFHLTDGKMKKKRYNQVLRRDATKSLVNLVKEKLSPPSPNDDPNSIVTITIFHEPGSGASTTARQVLWDFHQQLRCIIVQKAVMPTVHDILDVRKYGYGENDDKPPVMVLLDDLDDAEVIGLIAQLQNATRNDGCLSCIILHCKRTPNPGKMARKNDANSVVIEHALGRNERRWFVEKFEEYGEEYKHKPEKLIGFMVMKEECNPDYIQRIVHNILRDVTDKEAQLLKYIAGINKFMDDFGMPVSCCDELMNADRTDIPLSRHDYVPWEKNLTVASRLLLIQTRVQTKSGPSLALKLVNPVLATEVLKQLVEDKGQKIGGVIREFINESGVLQSQSYTQSYMIGKIRDLLIRRKKNPGDTEQHGWFSPFILYQYREDKEMAFEILKETSEQFKTGFIAQQLARLYNCEGNFEEAEKYATKALSYQPRNSFFLDTRGRIIIDEMKKYKSSDQPLDKTEAAELVKQLRDGIEVFKGCQDHMLEDSTYSRFAGYNGELRVIFDFLHILERRVEPFCLPGGIAVLKDYFLTDDNLPGLDEMWTDLRSNLKDVPTRADRALGKINDFLTFSDEISRTSQNFEDEMKARQLAPKLHADMLKYFAVDVEKAPPLSVQENPESMSSWRRAQVKSMNAYSFHAIFRLAQGGDKDHLKKVQAVLSAIHRQNAFDRTLLVCISFALASCGEPDVDYDTVVRQVKRLNNDDKSHYGALFALMLAWPRDDPKASSSSVGMSTTLDAVVNLRKQWNNHIRKRQGTQESQSVSDRSLPRPQSVNKASTYFFLAKGKGLNAFVHINMLHASPSTFEGDRIRFWQRNEVQEKLVRLEGTIKDKEMISFRTPANEIIRIKMSAPWPNQPSLQKVSFYLGFNFAEPKAYNVLGKDGSTSPAQSREYHEAIYPRYLISSIHVLQKREQDLVAQLDEIDYMSIKRRNRQQLMPEDEELMRSKPRLEEELQVVRAKIQEEIAKNDDDDELFILVTRKKKKGGGKYLRSTTAF